MRSVVVFSGLTGSTGDLLAGLRRLAPRPENRAFFATVCEAVAQTVAYLEPDVRRQWAPDGFPLRAWLSGPPDPPVNSVVEGLLGHVYQLCSLRPGGPASAVGPDLAGAMGHSLGLPAALVAASRTTAGDRFLALCAQSVRLVLLCLVRVHQIAGTRTGPAGPMATVSAIGPDELRAGVESFNRETFRVTGKDALEVTLVNAPRTHVVSGRPEDLLAFRTGREPWLTERRARWAFLPTTVPFHSSLLEPALDLLDGDRDFVGYELTGADLRVPVIATDAPRNLQGSADLFDEVATLGLVRVLDWPATVGHVVATCAPDRFVDFGPGVGASVFTRSCLSRTHRHLRYDLAPAA